jgi:hypothetical protein
VNVIDFDPARLDAVTAAIESALGHGEIRAVHLRLHGVAYLPPRALAALHAAAVRARAAGKELVVDGAAPPVYKALHVAQIATLVTRGS